MTATRRENFRLKCHDFDGLAIPVCHTSFDFGLG